MTAFTAADANAAAARFGPERQAITESLMNLEGHLGLQLLDRTALTGITHERRAEVVHGLARLWTLYELYLSVLERVRAIMGRRAQPNHAELREVEKLMTGATVALPDPDESLPSTWVTLDGLVTEIRVQYGRVHEVVTAVDRVWAELGPRFDRCETLLAEAHALAADLGLSADQDQAAAALTRLDDQLNSTRRSSLTDPLPLWIGNSVDMAGVDQLIRRCAVALNDLQTLVELRRYAQRRLDHVGARLIELRRLTQEISAEHHRVGIKIHLRSGSTPELADPLGPRLSAAVELYRRGGWQRLATELTALEQDSSTTLDRARAELAQVQKPLQERSELRGRLSAYRAKAARLGRSENLALEQCYQRARELLWRAPCHLTLAAAAVAQYQDAVNATVAGGEGG
jgi:hypothetical protein